MSGFLNILIMSISFTLSGCYLGITGRIIDAETQQPIEGAIVLVEWTKTHGYPFSATTSFKDEEVVSDSSGKVELSGIFNPFVNFPQVTVYKQGYVAWNSRFIFPPGYTKRTDFAWRDGYVFCLEQFRSEYKYKDHVGFIYSVVSTDNFFKLNLQKAINLEINMFRSELDEERDRRNKLLK